jgi:hypothetical protein
VNNSDFEKGGMLFIKQATLADAFTNAVYRLGKAQKAPIATPS